MSFVYLVIEKRPILRALENKIFDVFPTFYFYKIPNSEILILLLLFFIPPFSQKNSNKPHTGERGGSVVECRTPEREVRGSRPTAAMLCP